MKLSVMQENLARGLQIVSRAVSSRSTLPVLSNVLLRTEDAGRITGRESGVRQFARRADRRFGAAARSGRRRGRRTDAAQSVSARCGGPWAPPGVGS